jgi:GntR family transcriptional regulator
MLVSESRTQQSTCGSAPGGIYVHALRRYRVSIRKDPSGFTSGATVVSTMIRVKVDHSESVALHDQVAAEIRRAIADGEALPGERLPPARDLAAVLKVNTNTVFRALRLLRDEGLLEFQRGRGITVAGTPERGAVISRALDLIDFARHHGFRRDDLINLIQTLP